MALSLQLHSSCQILIGFHDVRKSGVHTAEGWTLQFLNKAFPYKSGCR